MWRQRRNQFLVVRGTPHSGRDAVGVGLRPLPRGCVIIANPAPSRSSPHPLHSSPPHPLTPGPRGEKGKHASEANTTFTPNTFFFFFFFFYMLSSPPYYFLPPHPASAHPHVLSPMLGCVFYKFPVTYGAVNYEWKYYSRAAPLVAGGGMA